MTITTTIETVRAGNGTMNLFIARPPIEQAPALLVIQEAFGITEHIADVTKRFAEQGYLAISPELFHRTAPAGFTAPYDGDFAALAPHFQALTPEHLIEDVRAAYDWITQDKQWNQIYVGSIGFCLGGRVSLLANSALPLQAAVSFYGGAPPNLEETAGNQHGPVLFFWGDLDQHLTPELRHNVINAMTNAGKRFINVEISDANHGFFRDAGKAYNPDAARQAWALTISFLATYLKTEG